MAIETIGYSLVASLIYCLAFYLKSSGESFQWSKACATAIVGIVIGVVSFMSGTGISETGVLQQLATYAGLVVIVEGYLKAIWRKVIK